MFLKKDSYFNIANIITYLNLTCGLIAIDFIIHGDFQTAIILAWIAGALDILDGKLARIFNLSSNLGIQLDSFADFLSFAIMPSFLLFYALDKKDIFNEILVGIIFIFYIISALIRLISFNLKVDLNEKEKFFTGFPTPLGAILLWVLYLIYTYEIITNILIIGIFVFIIGLLLNSKIKIPHP